MESKASIAKGLNHCKDLKSKLQNAISLMSFVAMEGIWTGGELAPPPNLQSWQEFSKKMATKTRSVYLEIEKLFKNPLPSTSFGFFRDGSTER